MKIDKYFNCNSLLLFLVGIADPYFTSCICHKLLESDSTEDQIIFNGDPSFEEKENLIEILPQELVDEVCLEKKIRFLVIGGQVAAAENIERNQTYPYLLCKSDRITGKHLAPDNIAPCIKKIVGNNIYDAIIIDLFDNSNEKLINLTRRLVDRFPKATIINMRQWFPGDVGFKYRKGWVNVVRWAKAMGQHSMTEDALKLFENSNRPWTLKWNKEKIKFYEQNNNENSIWPLYKDTKDKTNEKGKYWKDTLLRRKWMFDDWFVPNADGHKDIARGILGMVMYNETETIHQNIVGNWDDDYGTC